MEFNVKKDWKAFLWIVIQIYSEVPRLSGFSWKLVQLIFYSVSSACLAAENRCGEVLLTAFWAGINVTFWL